MAALAQMYDNNYKTAVGCSSRSVICRFKSPTDVLRFIARRAILQLQCLLSTRLDYKYSCGTRCTRQLPLNSTTSPELRFVLAVTLRILAEKSAQTLFRQFSSFQPGSGVEKHAYTSCESPSRCARPSLRYLSVIVLVSP